MANTFDADILYEYLVLGRSQTDIGADYNITQSDVSKIVHAYHFNAGNTKFGKGSRNQCGKYPNLDYDTLCEFMDSGAYSLDDWLSGNDGYYDDNGYEDEEEYYEEYYEEDDGYVDDNSGYTNNNSYNNGNYSGGYSAPQQPQYRNGKKVTYVNPDELPDEDYSAPVYSRNGKKVTYVNPDDYDDDGNYIGEGSAGGNKGRMFLLAIALIILCGGWVMKKYSQSSVIVASLTVLWQTKYLLYGLLPGIIFGALKYLSCRSLRETFSICGTYTWTALGLIVGGIAFFVKYCAADSGAALSAALVMIIPGALLGYIGYKFF